MTRRRFYAPPTAFTSDQIILLATEESRHLRDVLRLGPGDEIYVFDGEGSEFQCVIAETRRDSTQLRVVAEASPAKPESPLDLTLAIALLKGEKFDLVVQKATELGVMSIQPVVTERADVRVRENQDASKRVTRWRRIALEAAKQSGRARVPNILSPIDLPTLVKAFAQNEKTQPMGPLCLMFSERDGEPLSQTLAGQSAPPAKVVALVGSEGGWTDNEIEQACAAKWGIVTLGGRTMRAETAAIAVMVLLQNLLGDLD